jgi:hypothetical protein
LVAERLSKIAQHSAANGLENVSAYFERAQED